MYSIEPKDISTAKFHGLLLGAVAPRPIAFASTMDAEGNPNLSPFSFFNVFGANPATLIFSPSLRVRDGSSKHTLQNVQATKEVVINVVNYDIVQQASLSSTDYPSKVNEFVKSGLTMLRSDLVQPYRVAESPVQFECKVNRIIATGAAGGAGNLVICEVMKMHIRDEVLNEEGQIDQYKIDLVARAGGNYYSRARDGFFEIPKPLATLGIGIDQIPEHIRKSKVLTGNDLGMLGNVERLPSREETEEFVRNSVRIKGVLSSDDEIKIHKRAQKFLKDNDVMSAWKLLLAERYDHTDSHTQED
ncbi:NADH-FMN oxidoreductase RutF, flavin reductase (DIM6/NTAB) family [Sinomicrobium oceani]|uniref:NADH-FMN oxidoreductase RutF, flavin reductase (DIM6/NTAB) family n=1 Tax=Sinomicrobium oceani TaxID=1150368 RepID=A0A1K1N9N8_9FLAO|nr:flavin reductase family protein [Sinomicrobium oceani]SFW31062.1 NADH-FMN oxidoreductase RutF, flavin reductase (DIM6/NTAB) family [Sinomicrobium oceani]